MAIRSVVTRGFGNGTFSGTIPLVVTRGYAIGAALLDQTAGGAKVCAVFVSRPGVKNVFVSRPGVREVSATLPGVKKTEIQ